MVLLKMDEAIPELIIDKQFQELLPPLDAKTFEALRENIIEHGCVFPLITWEGILVDGHNRYAICTQHGIPFTTMEKEFNSREDVIVWIIGNQVARRNLNPMQLSYYRGLHYNTVKRKRGAPQGNRNQSSLQMSDNQTFVQEPATADKLSKEYKVSRDTIYTDAKAAAVIDAVGNASPVAKAMILAGDVAIDKKVLRRLADVPEDEIAALAVSIEEGTYEKAKWGSGESSEDESAGDAEGEGSEDGAGAVTTEWQELSARPKNSLINYIMGERFHALLNVLDSGMPGVVKRALRAYIDVLEGVYEGL